METIRGVDVPYVRRSSDTVSGEVWNKWFRRPDAENPLLVATVMFGPGCRSRWHRHAKGTTLYVTEGRGVINARGEATNPVTLGDVIVVPPGEWHWHGAAPDSFLVHFAVTPEQPTEWGEPVTEQEYGAAFVES